MNNKDKMRATQFNKLKISVVLIISMLGFTSLGYAANQIKDSGNDQSDEINNESNGNTEKQGKTIKILAIGNSFSEDAVEQYLYGLADAEGISVVIGNLYIPGCSLERHKLNVEKDSAAYEYRKIVNGVRNNQPGISLEYAIQDEDWDYISLQQVSGRSGKFKTFKASLPTLIKYVKDKATNNNMQLVLHQTWAYAQNSTHSAFPDYKSDQLNMYKAIVHAVFKAAHKFNIDIVVPSGTAVQNGRITYVGDTFNRDGYHLNLTYGRYTASCAWFEKIFGLSVIGNSFVPKGVDENIIKIAQEAAHAAVLSPKKITVLKDFNTAPVETKILKSAS